MTAAQGTQARSRGIGFSLFLEQEVPPFVRGFEELAQGASSAWGTWAWFRGCWITRVATATTKLGGTLEGTRQPIHVHLRTQDSQAFKDVYKSKPNTK